MREFDATKHLKTGDAIAAYLQDALDSQSDDVLRCAAHEAVKALAALPGGGVDGEAALDAVYDDFCAKDNGDVPLERYPQAAVDALARAGWAVVPCALPFAVLGGAAIDAVLDTGNPKHVWDYLIARTRIGPALPTPLPHEADRNGND